mgnify:CR=1 FL=1
MNISSYIIIAILAVVVISFIVIYNSLVRRRNQVHEAWSDIEVQLKRRYDLIPNVIETVKGYAAHERNVLEHVTQARTQAIGAKTLQEHANAENMLTNTLKTLFAVSENYPDLKANVNFLDLQRELADTENKIQSARRFYNTNVRDMNIAVESFPSNIIANSFNFKQEEFFELEDKAEKAVPQVKF